MYTNNNYWLLDSKNFFIKNVNINALTRRRRDQPDRWRRLWAEYYKIWNIDVTRTGETPYLFQSYILREWIDSCGSINKFIDFFLSFSETNETLFYDMYSQYHGLEQDPGTHKWHYTWWYLTRGDSEFLAAIEDDKILMLAIHPKVLMMNQSLPWNEYLEKVGLEMPATPLLSLTALDWDNIPVHKTAIRRDKKLRNILYRNSPKHRNV
jgi:hypothetical protein